MRPDPSLSRDARHTRWAWIIAASAFVVLIGAAGFRATPAVLMQPLHEEFGWSHGEISLVWSGQAAVAAPGDVREVQLPAGAVLADGHTYRLEFRR